MQYIGFQNAPRSFRAVLNGSSFYCPERIPALDEEVLIEKSFSQRLHMLLTPYFDGDIRLHKIFPSVSSQVGHIESIRDNFAVWRPRTHLMELPLRLRAAYLELFSPGLLQEPLHYFGSLTDPGWAFMQAFPVEEKYIYLPEGVEVPKEDDITTIYSIIVGSPKEWVQLKDKFLAQRAAVRFDGIGPLRTLGLMALIIHAVFEAGREKLWFYGDDFNLALPADNIEYITAAYYLAQAGLPIRKIFAISSQNRVAHNFFTDGIFTPGVLMQDAAYYASLYRLLYELSKGSMPKIAGWAENLRGKGSFEVDLGTKTQLHKKIDAHFAGQNLLDIEPPLPLQRNAHAAYSLSQEQQILTIAFEEFAPLHEKGIPKTMDMSDLLSRL